MTEKTDPITPAKHSATGLARSVRTRISRLRSRVRRGHVIAAGVVLAVVAAGGTAWAMTDRSGSPGATGPGPTGTAPGDSGAPNPDATGSTEDASFPVPTWTAPDSRTDRRGGRRSSDEVPPGMPTNLSAERDGETVVLQWRDNTNNEDGFTLFVTQGWTSYQINVPAGTTRYDGVTARRDGRICFVVVPFSWTNPVATSPAGEWECTRGRR